MNRTHLALTAVLLLGAVRLDAAGAEPPPPPPETPPAKAAGAEPAKDGAARAGHHHRRFGLLKEMDGNSDGKVTKEEFLARATERAAERFDKMDANHDGSIDRTEAAELAKRLREHMQKRSDKNPRRRPGSAAKTSA